MFHGISNRDWGLEGVGNPGGPNQRVERDHRRPPGSSGDSRGVSGAQLVSLVPGYGGGVRICLE